MTSNSSLTRDALESILGNISIPPEQHYCRIEGFLDETSSIIAQTTGWNRAQILNILKELSIVTKPLFEKHKKANSEYLAPKIIELIRGYHPTPEDISTVTSYSDARKKIVAYAKTLEKNQIAGHIISHTELLEQEIIKKAVETLFGKALPTVQIVKFF